MIYFKDGDIFKDTSEAIVNAVNCVGAMGKGIALKFKEKYPNNYITYKAACDNKEVKIGKMFICKENNKIIINFPTKQHWYNDSKIEYIKEGLKDLVKVLHSLNIESIAMPAIGCGNGGLSWELVEKTIKEYLSDVDMNIIVYNPIDIEVLDRKERTSEDMEKKYEKLFKKRLSALNKRIRALPKKKGIENPNSISFEEMVRSGIYEKFIEVARQDDKTYLILRNKLDGYNINNIIPGKRGLANTFVVHEDTKKCSKCKAILSKKLFHKDRTAYDGLSASCSKCARAKGYLYDKTKNGVISTRYRTQKASSKKKGMMPPDYTFDWFKNWILTQQKFHDMFQVWVDSGYEKDLSPSVDRINPFGTYTKDNIQLLTWKENNEKGRKETTLKVKMFSPQFEKKEFLDFNKNNKGDNMSVNYLVVVESMSKGRTIAGFLGPEYAVKASFGHIRNIKKGYDFKNVLASGCNPEYENDKDKIKIIKDLKDYINKDTIVYLASDEDREGEAISWHLIETLKLDPAKTKRIAFHEVTKPAILHALANPRPLDLLMVNAQRARQVLDKGVGYGLSPILWQKINKGLAAGRVMSVAVRIIVDRENEIRAFKPEEFWKFKALFQNPEFKAELAKKDGKPIKMEISNKDIADAVERELLAGEWVLTDIEEKDAFRNPPPPFITSTLQQVASQRLGMSIDNIMRTAQALYEGNIRGNIPDHKGGLITYMRTDSLNLSVIALDDIKKEIGNKFGKDYMLPNHRSFLKKAKGAQEAHEAIRPTNISLHPDMIAPYLDDYQLKLYRLIWNRTMATQMPAAKMANTIYKITAGVNKNYEFNSKGNRIVFPGFLLLDELKDDIVLPTITKGTKLDLNKLDKEQSFTQPPARFTESSFVKKLEDLGIGRPSTYASTISTIQKRKYVELDKDKKLVPTSTGEATNKFLVENFPNIVDIGFTSKMEEDLDKIAHGELEWKSTVENFAKSFMAEVSKNLQTKDINYREGRVIGVHPETKLEIKAIISRFGPCLTMGKKEDNNLKYAKIPHGKNANDLTLEEAIELFNAPKTANREVEIDKVKGRLFVGRFGPCLAIGGKFYSIPETEDINTVSIDKLKEIMKAVDAAKEANRDKPKFKRWKKKD